MNPPKIFYLHSKVLGATVLLTLTSAAAQAETLSQFFAASKIGGQIRSVLIGLSPNVTFLIQ